jgi:hypothetical protein
LGHGCRWERGEKPPSILAIEAEARSQLIEEAIAGVEGLSIYELTRRGVYIETVELSRVLALLRGLQESR